MQQSAQQVMNAPSTPLNLVSTEQIQKYLDENKNLIMAILECQKMGKVAECAQYQTILQKNLMYLAAIADVQPPGSSAPSQISTSLAGDSQIQQTQASTMQQQPGGPVAKMPVQLNAARPHDQQNQLLQFQQQQLQGQFSLGGGGGGANINNGLHMRMHPVPGHANMADFRGNQPGVLELNGQGNSRLGRDSRE